MTGGQIACLSGGGAGLACWREGSVGNVRGDLHERMLHSGFKLGGVYGEGRRFEVLDEGGCGDGVGEEVGGLGNEARCGAVALDELQVAVQRRWVRLEAEGELRVNWRLM